MNHDGKIEVGGKFQVRLEPAPLEPPGRVIMEVVQAGLADGDDLGRIVVVTDSRDRIVGAHVLAPHAGDLISQFTLAIQKKMRLTPDFTNFIQVYPTYSTSVQQLAANAIYGKLKEPFYRLARRVGSLLG